MILGSVSTVTLPRIAPAIPTLVEPFHRDGWVYEEKIDGWRIVAYKRRADVQLISRTGRDHTARFADIARAIAKLSPRTLILDGEVAVFDERLVSRFDLLGESSAPELATPPIFMAFDCLYRDGRDLRPLPLGERRRVLERIVAGDLVLPVRRLPAGGVEAWAEVQRRGYEGMVAKDESAAAVHPAHGSRSRCDMKACF